MTALLSEMLTLLTGLPLYIAFLFLLGTWVFFRGRSLMIRPRHRIDLRMADGGVKDLSRAVSPADDIRLPKSITTAEDRETQLEKRDRSTSEEAPDEDEEEGADDGDQTATDEEDSEDGGGDGDRDDEATPTPTLQARRHDPYRRFPIHDAPLWLMAWLTLLVVACLLLVADGLITIHRGTAYELEAYLAGWLPLSSQWIPLSRPLVALFAFTVLGYAWMELFVWLFRTVLGVSKLHLAHPDDVRRLTVQRLYKAFGFREFRSLDYSFPRWLFPVIVAVCAGLLFGDILLFYRGAPGWCGPLAVAHLLPIVVARMFDHAWLVEVTYRRSTTDERATIPLAKLPYVLAVADTPRIVVQHDPSNPDKAPEPVIYHLQRPRETGAQVKPFDENDGDLMRELLIARSGGTSWYIHQHSAWERARSGKHVMLCAPQHAGKSVWIQSLAVRKVLLEGGAVLLIYPDASSARRERHRLARAIKKTSLAWNIEILDATTGKLAAIDWDTETPFLVFSDLDTLGEELLVHWDRYRAFWRLLRMLCVEDFDAMSGVPASNLYYLYCRLETLRRRDTQADLQLAVTVSPVSGALEDEAAKIFGEPFVRVETDGAPRIPIQVCLVQPPDPLASAERRFSPSRLPPEILHLIADVRGCGHDPVYVEPCPLTHAERLREQELGNYDLYTGIRLDQTLAETSVSVVYTSVANALSLPYQLAHAGIDNEEQRHLVLLSTRPDPISALWLKVLAHGTNGATASELVAQLPRPGCFAFSRENRLLRRRHLTESLRETAMRRDELVALFGERLVSDELTRLDAERRLERLETGGDTDEQRYRLREGVRAQELEANVVTDDTVHVVTPVRGLEQELFQVDRIRSNTALYPGKVLEVRGGRYRVPLRKLPGTVESRLVVEPESREVFTTRIRRWSISSPTDERRRSKEKVKCQLGTQPFILETRWVSLREEIHGYREWTNDTHVCLGSFFYDRLGISRTSISASSVEVPMLEVTFPGATIDETTRHALDHVLRWCLEFRYANESLTPDVLDAHTMMGGPDGTPCVRICDRHPGGIGYVERIFHDDFVELLHLAVELLRDVGADRPDLLLEGPVCFGATGCILPAGKRGEFRPLAPITPVPDTGAAGPTDEALKEIVESLLLFLDSVAPSQATEISGSLVARQKSSPETLTIEARDPPDPELTTALSDAFRHRQAIEVQASDWRRRV